MAPATKQLSVRKYLVGIGRNINDASLGDELPESRLNFVQIFFDTASFDEIERDKKIKFEAQLSLIGGTLGLLTGFSIISGVEIICFITKLFFDALSTRT